MKKQKRIAITGGIGSGKSTLVRYLQKEGESCFSCDAVYRELRQTPTYVEKIRALFPECVTEGKIDARLLASLVFTNEEKRRALNALSHPLIMQKLTEEMDDCKARLVFAEVPLLFEGGFENAFDEIIVVTRAKALRIASLQQRDGSTKEEIARKIAAQFDYDGDEAKTRYDKYAVCIFENDGDEAALEGKMRAWLARERAQS